MRNAIVLVALLVGASAGARGTAHPSEQNEISIISGTGYANLEIVGGAAKTLYRKLRIAPDQYGRKQGQGIECHRFTREGEPVTYHCHMHMMDTTGEIGAGVVQE